MRSHTPTKLSRKPEPRRKVRLCLSGDAMKRLPLSHLKIFLSKPLAQPPRFSHGVKPALANTANSRCGCTPHQELVWVTNKRLEFNPILLFLISFRLVVQRKVARKSDTANQDRTPHAVDKAYNCRTGGRKTPQHQSRVPPPTDPYGCASTGPSRGKGVGKIRSGALGGRAIHVPYRGRNGPREHPRGCVWNPLRLRMGRFKNRCYCSQHQKPRPFLRANTPSIQRFSV